MVYIILMVYTPNPEHQLYLMVYGLLGAGRGHVCLAAKTANSLAGYIALLRQLALLCKVGSAIARFQIRPGEEGSKPGGQSCENDITIL